MRITTLSIVALKRLGWFVLAVSVFGFSVIAFANLFRNGRTDGMAASVEATTTNAVLEKRHALIESETVTATRRGFQPAVITRPQGKFILMIDNRSGEDLSFHLSRETGERLHEIRSSREQLDWNEVLDFQPGTYVLATLDHPEWTCMISITAR